MSGDKKFGTFGGVYTPSLMTILGVIMYLRLPWVVGSAGLYQTIGIILVAHVISVSTGLSISSIATDKAVGAGGPYYIISRSLGLPIGGALGLALFVGLSFSISLYVIGFAESLLTYFKLGASVENIRICGTLALILITIVTLVSTAFAIKAQYVIMAAMAVSLISIFMGGSAPDASGPHLSPPETGASPLPLVFAIFFPAVTGFTAGVNMSGDLRSPKQSIPRGTMLAIATGFFVYIGLAAFLAFKVPAQQLIEDPELLINIAWSGILVAAGIWAATLSSALGSIMGAPRILQAVSGDAITPRIFARGYGPTQEPRNALIMAFLLGEVGILIGELDLIARIVSMIFLTMYCVLNLSCAVESWTSADFRPEFRIPKVVSVIGALTSLVVMIQLDLAAMLGALAVMAGLFAYLSRKQLRLESGDAWEGFWSTVVRAGLARLTAGQRQARHWKPNVLAFQSGDETGPLAHTELVEALAGSAGILTHVTLRKRGSAARADASSRIPAAPSHGEPPPSAGIFQHQLRYDADPQETLLEFCRHYGFAGIEPNAVLLRWSEYTTRPQALSQLLGALAELDYNQIVLAEGGGARREKKQRIDVWWSDRGGNLPFSLSLARFITTSASWEGADIRFLLLSGNAGNNEVLRARARRYLERMRVDAEIQVINNTLDLKSQEQWAGEKSGDADLVLLPLPDRPSDADAQLFARMAEVLPELPDVLLIRASSSFEEVLAPGKSAPDSLLPPALEGDQKFRLPELSLPEAAAACDVLRELVQRYEELLGSFDEHCVSRVHGQSIDLVRRIRSALDQQFDALQKSITGSNSRRRRQAINRFMSSFVMDAQEQLDAYLREGLIDQQSTLEGRLEAFLQEEPQLVHPKNTRVTMERDAAAFEAHPDDPSHVRRFKRRRRLYGRLSRNAYRYQVRTEPLTHYTFERAKREILGPSLRQLVAENHQLAVHLGKLLTSARESIAALAEQADEQDIDLDALAELRGRTLAPFDELVERAKSRVRRHRRDFLHTRGHQLLSELAADLDRLDANRVARKERKLPRGGEALRAEWGELPRRFGSVQAQLYERAKVGLTLSAFHHRLTTIVRRQQEAVGLSLRNGALRVCAEVRANIEALVRALHEDDVEALKPLKLARGEDGHIEPKQIIATLSAEIAPALADLPESHKLLDDKVIDGLEEGRETALETVELSVRALGQFLVESELLAGVHEDLDRAPELEARAHAAARDVTRLVAFQLAELKELGLTDAKQRSEHMTPGLESALNRLDSEEKALQKLSASLDERFDAQLARVIAGSEPYRLSEAARTLGQHRRLRQGKMAVTGAQGLLRRLYAGLREGLVALLYRGSSGVVLARNQRLQEQEPTARVERLRALVRALSPDPGALQAMPFYYRQVFFGQALNESFWVGRSEELARAKQAAQSHREGEAGVLFVVGAQGSGKTALCQRIVSKALGQRNAFWVHAPPGGASDVATFRAALSQAVGAAPEAGHASAQELLEGLPRQAVVVLDDLELWWDRRPEGLAVIDELLTWIARHGREVLFLISINRHAFRLLCQLRPLAEQALSVIECGPMPARELGILLTLRHGSTGMKLELQGKQEDQLSSLQLARLFSRHFSYANGSVGCALRSWITHVEKVRDGVLSVRVPETPKPDALRDLPDAWHALLLQLSLHRRLSLARLRDITRLPEAELERDMEALVRTGLVTRSRQGLFEIDPFVHTYLLSHLEQQELLSA